jgi:hypothetical protein
MSRFLITAELPDLTPNGTHVVTNAPMTGVSRQVVIVLILHLFADRKDTNNKKVGGFALVRIDSTETLCDMYKSSSSFQFQYNV